MSRALRHDTAYALAIHLVSIFEPLLREEEKCDAFRECYDAALAALEAFEIQTERERTRLHPVPSKN
jgi:hypothetical protein